MHRDFNKKKNLSVNYLFFFCFVLLEPTAEKCVRVQWHGNNITNKQDIAEKKLTNLSATLYSLCFNGQTNQHFIVLALRFLSQLSSKTIKSHTIWFAYTTTLIRFDSVLNANHIFMTKDKRIQPTQSQHSFQIICD